MAYPASVITRTCTVGGSSAVESGADLVISVAIEASRGLIRDGERMPSSPETKTSEPGGEVSFGLPVSDQSGYRDEATGMVIDVSVPDSHTHTYTATITTTRGSKLVSQRVVNFPLPTGDLSPVDVDTLIDAGTVDGVLVSVPDSLTPRMVALEETVAGVADYAARLDALEAGGGTGGGVTEVSGVVTLPADGPRVVQMYTIGSTTINGETFAVDTALVARRTAAGVWQVAVVDSADWRAFVAPDATSPTVPTGLSATAASAASVNLAWSASSDAVGVTGYEYRVGGGAAVDAGAGLTETVTGLTASTLYSFEVRAYDAAGNRSGWSAAASATTSAPSADSTPPTAGTLASSSITNTGFTLTVSGASDAVALHATPYAFSTNNGSTWSAWQASAVYVASGLTASTGYQARHKVRDAAGNEATGTAITVTTGGAWAGATDSFDNAPDGLLLPRTTQTGGLTWLNPAVTIFNASNQAAPDVAGGKMTRGKVAVSDPRIRSIELDFTLSTPGTSILRVAVGSSVGTPLYILLTHTAMILYKGSALQQNITGLASMGAGSLRIERSGTTVTAYRNDVQIFTHDVGITPDTYWGMYLGDNATWGTVDNVEFLP